MYDFSLGVTAPPAKPDARIRHLGGSLLGNDLYNSDGAFQTLFPKVPAGRSRELVISIQNDSTDPDSFTVVASGTAANGFAARYYDRWPPIDVTSEIEAGTFTTPTLQPGAIYKIRVVVDVGLDAGIGEDAGLKRLVTVASTGQPSKLDAVGLLVTRRPGPV